MYSHGQMQQGGGKKIADILLTGNKKKKMGKHYPNA